MGILTTRINKGRLWSACVGILSLGFVSSLLIPSVFSFASASAESVGSSTLSVRVKDVIAIRILDDTGTSSISTLGIDIAPTPNGSTVTKNAIVDVATSNETGYTLYMDSDYKEDGTSSSTTPETQFNYTTDLIHTDPTVTVTIPSSVPSSSSDTNFWNYTTSWNDTIGTGSNTTTLTGTAPATVIPTHGTPDTIRDDVTESTDSSMTTIGINVNVNNDIPSGTYKNKLVFTAVANELPPQYTYLQEFDADASLLNVGDSMDLLDQRDNSQYTIRRLEDGSVWMVQGLRYSGATDPGATARYSGTFTTSATDSEAAGTITLVSDFGTATQPQPYAAYRGDASDGAYYNYPAAMMVCPSGWHLPTSEEYVNLNKAYGGSVGVVPNSPSWADLTSSSKANLTLSGRYAGASFDYDGAKGRYWASTLVLGDSTKAYAVALDGDSNNSVDIINPNGWKYYGFTIRCVANQKRLWSINTMQEMTPEICATTTTPTTSATNIDTDGSHVGDKSYVPQNTLTDTRDNNTYIVRKLADGNCWMAENLRAINTELAADQSDNLASNFTLPASALVNYSNGNSIAYAYTDPIANAGVLYSWYAAVGGTSTATSDLATGSICPKGWELPRDSGDKSMQNMVGTVYGGSSNVSIMRNSPISMPATAHIINGSYTTTGGWGNNYSVHYTAKSSAANSAYVVIGASNRVDLRYSHAVTSSGFSVRCVAK